MRKTKFGIELAIFFMSKGSSNPKLGFLKPNLIPHISPSEVNNIGTMKRTFGLAKQEVGMNENDILVLLIKLLD